jgi:hypothetical protein
MEKDISEGNMLEDRYWSLGRVDLGANAVPVRVSLVNGMNLRRS